MSFGVAFRNSIAIGLGGIVSLFSGRIINQTQNILLTESGNNMAQENGSLIVLE